MKLRNRETRLRGKLTNIAFNIDESEKEIDLTILLDNSDGECIDRQFYSLAEFKSFLRDWEEYEPEEPLIKDEKIRKAVRAWSEANGVDRAILGQVNNDELVKKSPMTAFGCHISFEGSLGLERGRNYTIEELCGEEAE